MLVIYFQGCNEFKGLADEEPFTNAGEMVTTANPDRRVRTIRSDVGYLTSDTCVDPANPPLWEAERETACRWRQNRLGRSAQCHK